MLNALETYLVLRRSTGLAMLNADYLLKSFARGRPSASTKGGLRSRTYATLIALLSATGLRISEAQKLTVADVIRDGLLIP